MGKLTTLLCAVTGIMTILDHFDSTPLFSTWLSQNVAKTPAGYEISPGLNFLVIVTVGGLAWLLTGSDAPPADAAAAKRLWRMRNGLTAGAIVAWLCLGPSIRRERSAPTAPVQPSLEQAPYFPPPLGKRR